MVDFGAEMAKLLIIRCMGGKGFSHVSNVGVGTGNSEVICIGVGKKFVGLRECGDKEI